ncbi:hypothetical protein ACQ4M3_07615 [Leptolyngbya sp. AN03gr2]|uniref:hypothetical protein n=1 Tax=unclassified Leptolyngbya TaxID=2650499 RepID=UPI003D31D489
MKILILGDTHADPAHIHYAIEKAQTNGCEQIIQVGDFGYFPWLSECAAFLDSLQLPLPLYY